MLGIWERRKPPEYYSASDFERVQWVSGIPARFWNTNATSISPKAFKYTGKEQMESVKASVQQDYLSARLKEPELMASNRLVVMTSCPTDDQALAAACLMATAILTKAWNEDRVSRVRVDDIQEYERSLALKREFYATDPDFLCIHNLNPNSSRERLSLVRDLISKNEGIYRVVVAVADNPFQFARESLYMEPHEVYHFEGKPKKVLRV